MAFALKDIQKTLEHYLLDGWLLYDFRRCNDLACQFLQIPMHQLLTRRFFYWIPRKGVPVKLVHAIEDSALNHLPGSVQRYRTWQEIEAYLKEILKGSKRIAMEYSPRNAIPYASKVDAGTMDVVRDCGVEVVSSADLLQQYINVWDADQLKTHLFAADVLCRTVDDVWAWIAQNLQIKNAITEYDVQQFILQSLEREGCVTSDAPICAVNENSANPHYSPDKNHSKVIKMGDFILIDLWCKQQSPGSVYADITRVGVAASAPTEYQKAIFDIVKAARDKATGLVRDRFSQGEPVRGCEVDQCCRNVIQEAGYGDYFIHRTGHNIGENDHGSGAHIDNLETRDTRLLLPGTCFSIEPGIYLPGKFGVRLEYDVYVHLDGEVNVTGGIQNAITCLIS